MIKNNIFSWFILPFFRLISTPETSIQIDMKRSSVNPAALLTAARFLLLRFEQIKKALISFPNGSHNSLAWNQAETVALWGKKFAEKDERLLFLQMWDDATLLLF